MSRAAETRQLRHHITQAGAAAVKYLKGGDEREFFLVAGGHVQSAQSAFAHLESKHGVPSEPTALEKELIDLAREFLDPDELWKLDRLITLYQ